MRILNVVAFLAFVGSCVEQGSSKDAVCRHDNGYFQHDDYCDYYYECINGVATLQLCPNGLVFVGKGRGLLQSCDYQKRGGCPDGVRVMGQSPIQTENCDWLWGRFPHKTSCTSYLECWNGTSTNHKCGYSLLYNTKSESCDWPENVQGCQQHPTCKKIPNGPIAIEKSCSRYILCSGGYPYMQRCAAGLAFDPDFLSCKLAETVPGCEPKPTEAPEYEDEEPLPQAPPRQNYQSLDSGSSNQVPPPSRNRQTNRSQYRPGK
ncbi:protein obstructor-E-like [Limulus polyphemus]|uniref:Protein obstructor-E-like n=1 Tax=Limulus polyphemus TaxID=6850 RepID=A0ABM1BGL1_LIMPO|nr:protein obstructor-E-like [Limulus polyphemus]